MSMPDVTRGEHHGLIHKLVTLETELKHNQKLLEAPAKVGWWRRFWGLGSQAAVVALVVAFLLLPAVSIAGSEEVHKRGLRGLKGVYVAVEMDPQAERLGLTEAQILTDVELRIRKAGVRVLTMKELAETPGLPYLSLRIGTYIDKGLVAFSILVELVERVTLARGFVNPGAIWNAVGVGIIETKRIQKIRAEVGDYVDKFIKDYLEMNPK